MAYTTKYNRSTANHRIANKYKFNYTVASKDGKTKTFTKTLIVPWEVYSSCSSCSGKYRLRNALFGCAIAQAIKIYGEDNYDLNKCDASNIELVDRLDQTNEHYKKYEEFACEKLFVY